MTFESAQKFTIGELASSFSVSLRTLRFYEEKGFLSPMRVGTARYYSVRDRIRIELILKGKRLGFTLDEIGKLISAHRDDISASWKDIASMFDQRRLDEQLAGLERQRDEIDHAIEELRAALAKKTVETAPTREE